MAKLGDRKVAVRQANNRLLAVLRQVLQPGNVLDALSCALMHNNWKIREAAVNVFTQVPSYSLLNSQYFCGTKDCLGVAFVILAFREAAFSVQTRS